MNYRLLQGGQWAFLFLVQVFRLKKVCLFHFKFDLFFQISLLLCSFKKHLQYTLIQILFLALIYRLAEF